METYKRVAFLSNYIFNIHIHYIIIMNFSQSLGMDPSSDDFYPLSDVCESISEGEHSGIESEGEDQEYITSPTSPDLDGTPIDWTIDSDDLLTRTEQKRSSNSRPGLSKRRVFTILKKATKAQHI